MFIGFILRELEMDEIELKLMAVAHNFRKLAQNRRKYALSIIFILEKN